MKKIFQNIGLWLYLKFHSIMVRISIALYNTEEEILKANPSDLDERKKISQRKRNNNQVLEKFYAGKEDKKYVQDYYEILKKADNFVKTATPHQMAVAGDKHGSNYGLKDQYGRRYEHYGFFDDKHKHSGKTLGEVLSLELEERRTKDDDLSILYVFNNTPIEVGLVDVFDVVRRKEDSVDEVYEVLDMKNKSKQFKFPIQVLRDNEVVNKIEELAEFLHVKKIGFDHRQLEFFIPLKYRTNELLEDSKVFLEIINVKNVYVRDDYGSMIGFVINKFSKRIIHNDVYEVLKFDGLEMKNS